MALLIEASDLAPFATIDNDKLAAMIADAEAWAATVAPCLAGDLSADQSAAAKAVLRGAILRWNDAGNGAVQSQNAGPFGMTLDTRQERRGMFWPSEIVQLQAICSGVVTPTTRTSWLA